MGQGLGAKRQAVGSPSQAYADLDAYVAGINGAFDDIFLDLEQLAGTEPDTQTDTLHEWRGPHDGLAGHDAALLVETQDELTFTLRYAIGPTGFDAQSATPVVSGQMILAQDGSLQDFELVIDLDAVTAVDAAANASGDIVLRAQPLAGGQRELWYDFRDVSIGGSAPTSSITTYWSFSEGSAALEYVAAQQETGISAVAYARWAAVGGRVDAHAAYTHASLGPVEEVGTSCWDGSANSAFDANAIIDESGLYGAVDGVEGDCAFGPLDDHPNPRGEFDALPAEGEWDDLELQPIE